MWVQDAGLLHLIAREGGAAPGTEPGVLFGDTLEVFAMNGLGHTLFDSALTGLGVTSANDRGIWVHDPQAGVQLVLREGQSVEVLPGDVRVIASYLLSAYRSGGQDGRKEVLNDAGQFVITLSFTDGSSGLFIATVPEPGTWALLATLGALGLSWQAARRGGRRRRLANRGI